MKKKLIVPLLLLAGMSLLLTPVLADDGAPLPIKMESQGVASLRVGKRWIFSIYSTGCADFWYKTYCNDYAALKIYDCCGEMKDWQVWGDVDWPNHICGGIYTLKARDVVCGSGYDNGEIKIVLLVTSDVPDDLCGYYYDCEATGKVIVYGRGTYYVGCIDFIKWEGYCIQE